MAKRKYTRKNIIPIETTKKSGKTIKTIVIPKNVAFNKVKKSIEAYKSGLSNLFSSNDPTLSTEGFVRLFTDTGYYGDVQKSLSIYQQDDMVGGLIDSFVNVSNSRINFDLPSNNESEAEVWDTWARLVNIDTKGLPGLTILNEQIMKSMILTGMAIPDFEWGEVKIGKRIYILPVKINIYPSLGVKLRASTTTFGEEDVLLGVSKEFYNSTLENAINDIAIRTLFSSFPDGKQAMIRNNAFPIKFKYTPNNQTLYPTPMLRRSFESIALRHRLLDSDLSTLEMIINKIIQIKVGDKDNPPMATQRDEDGNIITKGDIETAQEMFELLDAEVEVLATPYYYEIAVVMPDTNVLLNQEKYIQSSINILSNFGIIMDPNSRSSSNQFEKINLKSYEKNAENIQDYVSGWYNWLANKIVAMNQGKLKAIPSVSFDKPDIYTDNFLSQLSQLYTLGAADVYTLLEKFGLDPKKIKERKKMQEKEDKEKIWEPRASFKQEVAKGDSGSVTKTTSTSVSGGTNDKNKTKGNM